MHPSLSERIGENLIYRGDALAAYGTWPSPTCIISDGAYGVGGFPGDPRTTDGLAEWYRPHVEAWSERATLATSLWFWNTEVGWANVHPLLVANGWQYEFTATWNKGIAHVAGNINSRTIRRMPVVTEVCVLYTRTPRVPLTPGGELVHIKEWLLREWERTGLPRREANTACGVKDAATRKYFDQGWRWYPPTPAAMGMLAAYANDHGDPAGAPYYSLDGLAPLTPERWTQMRSVWNHAHGITNVWDRPTLRSHERFKGSMTRSAPRVGAPTAASATHLNQKPLDLMERIVSATTNPGDVVWEPFGGLATATVAAVGLGRRGCVAEVVPQFADLSTRRIAAAVTAKPRT